jgi:hypothetical protein
MSEDAMMSRMLFEAREHLEMWFDVVKARTGREDTHLKGLIDRIDTYRREQGWSPHGFGGEDD